ncbi:MAG: tRNA pseudouridine(13) synthase TruD [Pseudoxanthomonas suwonensis]|nr:tRNA pseudouridine(13) synthase TruD [Pseudoxanthomonas suwonensis]
MSATRAHGPAVLRARTRHVPEDFIVEELDAFAASGSGEHLLLKIRKRGMNTAWAATRIARWAGVAESAIGHAGLKDRHAQTVQRFSVWLPKRVAPPLESLQAEDFEVLAADWHSRKLPRGALAGNRFVLLLREVRGARDAIEARLQAIAARGVPNVFGEQRFGRQGGNVAKALAMFDGRRVRRDQRGILLSAARSQLFNQVLAARIDAGCWDRPLDGEIWILDGSHSMFGPEPFDDALAARLAAFDIHPTGPMWGRGGLRSNDAAAALELAATSDATALALRTGLEAAGLRQERRSLRLPVRDLRWDWQEASVLRLGFALPPGSYATAVLAELGEMTEPDGSGTVGVDEND